MRTGCIWIAIAFIALVLLVVGVVIPRSILHSREHRSPSPAPVVTTAPR